MGCARFRGEDGKQHYEALGAADDARDADGLTVYSFPQAQERARGFFAEGRGNWPAMSRRRRPLHRRQGARRLFRGS